MPEIKVKCKCGETRIECFSNPEKEKRCRACLKAAKNSPNKKEQVVDTEQTDPTHSNWQGGKYAGSVFQRTGDANAVIACVAGKQKRFRFVEYANDQDKTKREADKYRKQLSDELEETRNKYKVISINNKPKYLIVKLSKNYCTLIDYKYLDFVKSNNMFVSKNSREHSKHYCLYGSSTTNLFHRHVLGILEAGDKVLGDHINRYPLDNREVNLRQCSHSVNNGNKSVINSMEYAQSVDKFVGTISYRTNPAKPQITISEKFGSMELAKQWARNKVKELDLAYAEMSDEAKTLAKEFETIMTQHAGDYKWSDIDELDNWDVDNEKAEKVDNKKEILSVVTSKKEIYNKFKLINPDFVPGSDILTSDRKIHHLTHEKTEYKYCSACDKWVGTNGFPSNKKNYDGLDRRCKTCKYTLAKKYKDGKFEKEQDEQENVEAQEEIEEIPDQPNQHGGQIIQLDLDDDYDEDEQVGFVNEKLNQIIQDKAGALLTGPCAELSDRNFTVRVRCNANHIWDTKIKNIYRDIWCPTCGLEQTDEAKEKISLKMTQFFASESGKQSKVLALAKRSETMRARKQETIANIQNKQCKGHCGQVKPINDFCKKAASADGYQSWCKSCTNDKKKATRTAQVANEIEV